MPLERVIVPEWRDEQLDSRYPFSDSSTLISSSGVKIDKDLFIDAVVYAIGIAAPMYLRSITYDYNSMVMSIEDSFNEANITGKVNPFSDVASVPLFNSSGEPAGLLVIDAERLTRLKNWPIGVTEFGDNAEFVASVVIPVPENLISGFILPDDTIISGDIWLYGDSGVVIRKKDGVIRFDVVGEPLFERVLCDLPAENLAVFKTPNFLKTINHLPPDDYGNFTILTNNEMANDSILRIYPDTSENVVRIELIGQKLEGGV